MGSSLCEGYTLNKEERKDLSTLWNGTIHWDVAMADYCTFRAGGKVEALLVVSASQELEKLMQWLHKNRICWKVIGRGSNILVQSKGFDGVVIILGSDFNSVEYVDGKEAENSIVKVRVGAGCSVARLVGWCCNNEVSGVEFLVGIPGSVGGAIRMNAGAWGSEIGSSVDSVTYIDPNGVMQDVSGEELIFTYRQLQFKENAVEDIIIVETVLLLKPGRQKEIIAQCREYQDNRRSKQPLGAASAGSFFKNPPGDSAGRLIDAAGLKGLCRGNAMVSPKHANFIVNTGQATADDIVELMKEVQEKVYLHSGVKLEPEVHIM